MMVKKSATCPHCHTKVVCEGEPGKKVEIICSSCGNKGVVSFAKKDVKEIDFYPLNEPFAYVKIVKDNASLDQYYKVIEPHLPDDERKVLLFIQEKLMDSLDVSLEELNVNEARRYLNKSLEKILGDYDIKMDNILKKKVLYYIERQYLGYAELDPLMKDPNIEDISCDGAGVPIFLYHRIYGSLKSNVEFKDEEKLSDFVVNLAQKCGKHISIAEPMLDATMPDGSRIQMTLSKEVTTRGSTFTIRKFRSDPFTPVDMINFNTMSSEMMAYMWMIVENGTNALIAGGTASGKTSTLNALSLFIPHDSKIVSIEETREINLPHPNWIPGVARSGFGEIVADRMVGEIDMYDLMKAALRQRPEYILVGEIRGKEAYVLFQAMATGHTTYSTFHADSAKALIHRLEGKPIEIPRIMIASLNVVTIQISARVNGNRVRRCKQIVEIIDIDPTTKEILTNEVFHWDPIEDSFMYSGKSYILERIRARWDMSKEKLLEETKIRVEILEWMREKNVRSFKEVAAAIAQYSEKPEEFMQKIRMPETRDKNKKDEIDYKIEEKGLGTQNNDTLEGKLERKKNNFWFRKKSKEKKVKRRIRKK